MKISIGTNIKDGPWGGGNLFAINLKDYLISQGHKVVHNLDDNDIDIILITEPRKTSESSAFNHQDVMKYLRFVNYESLVFHRINECDERKGTNYVNKYLINANKVADGTIFVSDWIKNLYIDQGLVSPILKTIKAGANTNIFNNKNYVSWNKKEKIRITTHHWGANWNKGFKIYKLLDDLLTDENWRDKIEFNYIGNLPQKFKFNNTNVIPPLSGIELANEIKKNHLYVTGSINEPSGNHHIEAAQCGLPILFLNSGGVPEYCKDYGVEFNDDNFEIKLQEIIENYDTYVDKTKSYRFNSSKMCEDYLNFFNEHLLKKSEILSRRDFFKNENKILLKYHLIKSKFLKAI